MAGAGTKLRREVRRLRLQVRDVLSVVPERIAQRRIDSRFPGHLRQTEGGLPAGGKVALFLIWQPAGLAASTIETCRHLSACGYAPLIVSNAPLSTEDWDRLAPLTWRMVERPNLGHDFGGYRDGIRLLHHLGQRPERLLLLNDSIWFPLLAEDGLLAAMERQADGFIGAAWMERPGRSHAAHFQSYLLMFGPRALAHPAFARFWNGYLVSSRRDSVLKRGEKGLSRVMAAAGLAVPPTISPARLLAFAEAAEDGELRRALDYAAFVEPKRVARRDRLLAAGNEAGFRPAALALISSTLMSGYFLETHPYLAARAFGMHFLKKRREATSIEARRQVLRAVAAGDLPAPQPTMLGEIRGHDA